MLPQTSTLERSTSQNKILPSHVPDLNPIAWTASRMTAAAGHCPGTAMSSTLLLQAALWESQAAPIPQKPARPPLLVEAIPPLELILIPPKGICHYKSVFPQDPLLYHNNLLAFAGLPHIVQALLCRMGKTTPPPLHFRSLFLCLQKFPTRMLLLLLLYIFILPIYNSTNCCPLPMPPVLTSGQHFL